MAVKIIEYDSDKPLEYIKFLNNIEEEETIRSNAVYYIGVVTALRHALTEVHSSLHGTTYTDDTNSITLSIVDGSSDTKSSSVDYKKLKQHIELYCDKTKHLIRILPSPVRDGNVIISLYTNSGPTGKRVGKNTTIKYEIITVLERVMYDSQLASILYAFLVDPNSADMDTDELSDRSRLTKGYH